MLVNRLKAQFPDLSDIQEKLRVVVDEAQNEPPEGAADGTIDATSWGQLQQTERALSTLLLTLLFHGPTERQPDLLTDDEIDALLP